MMKKHSLEKSIVAIPPPTVEFSVKKKKHFWRRGKDSEKTREKARTV
jgi:hypothetical protein